MPKVYVLNRHGRPLMPCTPAKARHLLDAGKAKVRHRTPFTIQLLYGSTGYTQEVILGVDAGSFGWLKNFCKRNGIPRIVIQSVETKEMSNWCIKNGFQPDEYASMPIGGFVIGNYLLDCF